VYKRQSDGSATLHITSGAPPYTIVWQEFPGSSDTLLQNLHQGIYHVTVSDSFCSVSSEVEIINIPGPLAGFRVYPLSTSIDDPHITFYDESVGATEWYWDFGDNRYSDFQSPSHDYRDSGMFKVVQMISDDQGCMDSISHTVLIIGPILLWIPNVFSPNGDGLNDRFEIYGQHLTDYELYIYDRWGETVFHTKDPMTYWDGTYQGKVCEGGVYSWVLWYREDYELFTMDRKVTYGSVTIYR
jgi:gliding motility-associated-like protein